METLKKKYYVRFIGGVWSGNLLFSLVKRKGGGMKEGMIFILPIYLYKLN